MGLDITAFRRLAKIAPPTRGEDDADADEVWRLYVNPEFRAQADDIEDGAAYGYEDTDSFRAGSYSGYSSWREELAKLAGYPRAEPDQSDDRGWAESHPHSVAAWDGAPRPFSELVNFSDCEGVIGPKTSAKLARDFAEHQGEADAHPDAWFRERYAHWRKAFEMAADDGAVLFH